MFYESSMAVSIIITVYVIAAVLVNGILGHNVGLFRGRAIACVLLGSVLGVFVGGAMFSMSRHAGYVGIGLSIGLVYILLYSRLIERLINRIPEGFRNGVRTAFRVIRIVLVIGVIICVVVIGLNYMQV